MTRTLLLAFAVIALFGGAAALWTSRPAADTSATASYLDAHRNAHLDGLPVQDVDDQTFVYPQTAGR